MNAELAGSVAVVIGGAKGIGRAIAVALAQEGADLILVGRDVAALDEAAAAIRGMGQRVRFKWTCQARGRVCIEMGSRKLSARAGSGRRIVRHQRQCGVPGLRRRFAVWILMQRAPNLNRPPR